MKNLYFIGFILWFFAAYFSYEILTYLAMWIDDLSSILKLIIVLLIVVISIFGFHKIILGLILFNHKSNKNFNLISTIYSIIGFLGIIVSFSINQFSLDINDDSSNFSKSLTLTAALFFGWILINGFIMFPKSIIRFDNK